MSKQTVLIDPEYKGADMLDPDWKEIVVAALISVAAVAGLLVAALVGCSSGAG